MFSVNCVEPAPATVAGLKLPLNPAGSPERPNVTVPVKPFSGVTVIVEVAVAPASAVTLVGLAVTV